MVERKVYVASDDESFREHSASIAGDGWHPISATPGPHGITVIFERKRKEG